MAVRTHIFITCKFKIIFEDIDGLRCDTDNPPEEEEKSISISPRLSKRYRLEVLIHEMLHAEYPSLKGSSEEEWVDEAARNISSLLWRLGYRETKDPRSSSLCCSLYLGALP